MVLQAKNSNKLTESYFAASELSTTSPRVIAGTSKERRGARQHKGGMVRQIHGEAHIELNRYRDVGFRPVNLMAIYLDGVSSYAAGLDFTVK